MCSTQTLGHQNPLACTVCHLERDARCPVCGQKHVGSHPQRRCSSSQLGSCNPSLWDWASTVSFVPIGCPARIPTFHQRPALTAVPPPSTHPSIWSVSWQAMPVESCQISLQRPGTSNRVRFVAPSQAGFMVPPHRPEDGGPFSISRTLFPAWLSLSAMGIPPAPAPTTI
jgi:hypothetical protein